MITLRDITLRRGVKVVLEGAQLKLMPGEKVGLIGRNGAGKSSLFALLAGRLQADRGEVEIPAQWRLSEVAQHMPDTSDSATDFVLQGDTPLQAAMRRLQVAEAANDGHAIAEAHHEIDVAGGFDARARAQALLMGLGFQKDQLDRPVDSFSGGWRMRLQLARALMCPADWMLLDEPTNHLDLDALVWLEAWLQRYEGTLLIISHDREFLDAITRVTVHLDEARLTRYGGNYTAFEEMRAERLTQQQAQYARQQDRITHLQRFIDRFKAKATKAKQAQSRVKALARMEKLAPVLTAADFQFEFREPTSLPNPMLALRDWVCGYPAESPGQAPVVIVQGVTRSVRAGQRIGVLGANGQGKSTLVKTIAQDLKPLGGQRTEGKGLSIGYFAQQELDVLQLDDGPLMHMVRLARDVGPPAREQELRDFLGRFRFIGDMVSQAVGTLSGGEKARLVLAMLVWQRPNLLLLDEPTNHLDLPTREALSMALNEFEGTVLLVSHDRALLREVCDEFWLVAQGGVHDFEGDLDDYQRWLLEVSRAQTRGLPPPIWPGARAPTLAPGEPRPLTAPVPSPSAPPAASARDERAAARQARAKRAEQTRPLRVELDRIEQRLARLGQEKSEWEAMLCQADLPRDTWVDAGRQLNHIAAETETLEARWLELQATLETFHPPLEAS